MQAQQNGWTLLSEYEDSAAVSAFLPDLYSSHFQNL
jgi:hypothetical protein